MGRGSRYNETYKREAVEKAKSNGNVSQTARELGISNKTLHGWIKRYGEAEPLDVTTATSKELAARVRELEKQLAMRDQQIEVLKKAIGIVSQAEPNDSV
jgi:transposase